MNNNKVVILGDSTVGKSSILQFFKYNRIDYNIESTIGCEFYSKTIIINNTNIKLLLWDTAGQEIFRSFTSNFLRNASIIVIVYDITNIKTFENIKLWLKETTSQPNAKIVICGNKSDLSSNIIPLNYIEEFKQLYPHKEIHYYGNVSAKIGTNIHELFNFIGSIILDEHNNQKIQIQENKNKIINLNNMNTSINNKKCNC